MRSWPHTSISEVNNAWRYTSSPPYVFMAWRLVKHRDNFTFTITKKIPSTRIGSWSRGTVHSEHRTQLQSWTAVAQMWRSLRLWQPSQNEATLRFKQDGGGWPLHVSRVVMWWDLTQWASVGCRYWCCFTWLFCYVKTGWSQSHRHLQTVLWDRER
jgi:hypothetical protein